MLWRVTMSTQGSCWRLQELGFQRRPTHRVAPRRILSAVRPPIYSCGASKLPIHCTEHTPTLRQLAASSYQERKRLLHNGALLTLYNGPAVWSSLSATHSETVVCHYTHSSGDIAAWWTPSGAVAAFLRVWRRYIRLLTYLLTCLLSTVALTSTVRFYFFAKMFHRDRYHTQNMCIFYFRPNRRLVLRLLYYWQNTSTRKSHIFIQRLLKDRKHLNYHVFTAKPTFIYRNSQNDDCMH